MDDICTAQAGEAVSPLCSEEWAQLGVRKDSGHHKKKEKKRNKHKKVQGSLLTASPLGPIIPG